MQSNNWRQFETSGYQWYNFYVQHSCPMFSLPLSRLFILICVPSSDKLYGINFLFCPIHWWYLQNINLVVFFPVLIFSKCTRSCLPSSYSLSDILVVTLPVIVYLTSSLFPFQCSFKNEMVCERSSLWVWKQFETSGYCGCNQQRNRGDGDPPETEMRRGWQRGEKKLIGASWNQERKGAGQNSESNAAGSPWERARWNIPDRKTTWHEL